ncbi:MAG: putative CRISPR-associated protein [Aggregatilineales bacterium]
MLAIISTVGTTVFGQPRTPLNEDVRKFRERRPSATELSNILNSKDFEGRAIYEQALAELSVKPVDMLRRSVAELNAIEAIHERHNVRRGNAYYFLASETPDGMLAARVLADFCRERYEASESTATKIDGLQVADPRKFRLTGLPYLVQTVYRFLESAKAKKLTPILNSTGGFKAAIPYLTLVGMLQGVEVSTIHETSDVLITLETLPITLDLEAIREIEDILEELDQAQENGLSYDRLARGLKLGHNQPIEDHPLWSLFEPYDDNYILSGLGSIALEELRAAKRKIQPVWLSQQAYERLQKDFPEGSEARRHFKEIFDRLKRPDYRKDPWRHEYKGAKFPAYKYKGNERLFFHEHSDGYVLVLELAQHVSDHDQSYDRVPGELSAYDKFWEWQGTF